MIYGIHKHEHIVSELFMKWEEYFQMVDEKHDMPIMMNLLLEELHKTREENIYLKRRLEHAKQ